MIGIICGMASEADCIRHSAAAGRFEVRVSGAAADRAAGHADALAAAGAEAILSFGLSGALEAGCAPGQLVLARATHLPEGGAVPSDAALFERLRARAAECMAELGAVPAVEAEIAGNDTVVGTPRAKQALLRRTGALAVDMESHAAARAARARGLPFAAIRAIADPAARAIPPTALAGLAPDGTTRPWPVIRGLMSRPQDLPALIRLGRDAGAGLETLRRAALHLLPVL